MTAERSATLTGVRVLVTRAREQASPLCRKLEDRGAIPVMLPAIEIRPLVSDEIDRVIDQLHTFDWLVLTSSNAARTFARILESRGRALSEIVTGISVAAVGDSTAETFRKLGGSVDLVPNEATGSALAESLLATAKPASVFIPGSRISRPELPRVLREAGVSVTTVAIYDTVCPNCVPADAMEALERGAVDVATFTSPSTVQNACQLVGVEMLARCRVVTIGPTTSEAARNCGLTVDAEAQESSMTGLVAAVESIFATARTKGER